MRDCCGQEDNTRVYIEYEGVMCYSTLRKGNRVVSLPCIDTPLGGREVRLTVDI